ncbi:MAG: diiron oxygenase [Chloroflexi bacterium]|nr:MAG: diiron oxygenase [Chloroflexota bacterium]
MTSLGTDTISAPPTGSPASIRLDLAPAVSEREETAQRLLRAAAKRSFDPASDIDWTTPINDDDWFYIPEHRVSLYGTRLWESMTRRQRIALSRHEVASMAQTGIWFELILMQLLVRFVYDEDLTSHNTDWVLTEIADECRHSSMFARLSTTLGGAQHHVSRRGHLLGRILKTIADPPEGFAAILIAEELLDTFQRETMVDEAVHPLVRSVSQLHVVEEARHVKFAREELERQMHSVRGVHLQRVRMMTAWAAAITAHELVQPSCYSAVGLDPREALRAARASRVRRDSLTWAASKLTTLFEDVGLIAAPSRRIWRDAGLLAA